MNAVFALLNAARKLTGHALPKCATAATGLFIALCFDLPPRSKVAFGWALFAIASLLNAGEILWCIHILVENGFDWGRVGAIAQTSIWFLVGIETAKICSVEYKIARESTHPPTAHLIRHEPQLPVAQGISQKVHHL